MAEYGRVWQSTPPPRNECACLLKAQPLLVDRAAVVSDHHFQRRVAEPVQCALHRRVDPPVVVPEDASAEQG